MSKITQSELKEAIHYEPETGLFFWRSNRANNKIKIGDIAGSITFKGYITISVKNTQYRAHHLAWFYIHGEWPIDRLDHINQIRCDNRILNLREVNNSENLKNKTRYKNNTTGISGVYWHSRDEVWQPKINLDGRQVHLGYFNDFFEACCARKSAEVKFEYHENHGKAHA